MDIESVKRGLDCRANHNDQIDCTVCPYFNLDRGCEWSRLLNDALDIVKVHGFLVDKCDEMLAELKNRPEVVHCRECKYSMRAMWGAGRFCALYKDSRTDDWYCADGRKD